MIFAYLILAHLIGDFIFQPTRLVHWKIKSKSGVFIHILIHFFLILLVLSPIIILGYYWLIGITTAICFIHFWIDEAKISHDLKNDKKVRPFVIDQLLHLLSIFVVYFFISDIKIELPDTSFYKLYSDIRIVIFISFIVFSSSVIEVYRYQKVREKNKSAKFNIKTSRILDRIIVFSIIYIFLIFLAYFASGKS